MNRIQYISRKKDRNTQLDKFIYWSWFVIISAFLLQCIFFDTVENIFGAVSVLIAWFLVANFFLKANTLQKFPLTSLLVLGFTLTQFYFPLLFTLLEAKPVVFNLVLPYEVFGHSLIELIVILFAHYCYRQLVKNKAPRNRNSLMVRGGFFTPPTDLQLWIMGLIGLICAYYVYLYSGFSSDSTSSDAGNKFLVGFVPFSYAPFFIPLRRLYGGGKTVDKRFIIKLSVFTVLLFLISIGRNSRGAFMFGFTSLGFAYGLALLLGIFKPRILTFKNVLIAAAGLWVLTGPMADLATAMVLIRGDRSSISTADLIEKTFEAYSDKRAIELYRVENNKGNQNQSLDWDESYLSEVFLARFCNIKINDLSLIQAKKIGGQDPEMLSFTINRLLSLMPTPVIRSLGLNADVYKTSFYSTGDYLYYRANGASYALGGYRTGHLSGTGMAAFGWWYLLVLGVGLIPAFYLIDKFSISKTIIDPVTRKKLSYEIRFSVCGLLIVNTIFLFLPSESAATPYAFMMRGWIQTLLLYYIIFKVTALIVRFLGNSSNLKNTGTGRSTVSLKLNNQ